MSVLEQNEQEQIATSQQNGSRFDFVHAAAIPPQAQKLISIREELQNTFMVATQAHDVETLRTVRSALHANKEETDKLLLQTDAALLDYDLGQMRGMIANIVEDNIGQSFLAREKESSCKIGIDLSPHLKTKDAQTAGYQTYSYDQGLINEILINGYKLGSNIYSLINKVIHEEIHSFQAMSAPALRFSHSNPDTRIIVHPEDWIHLENLCERDAYAKQGMMNHLLSKTFDDEARAIMKTVSKFDVVSAEDFENYRSVFATLRETVVHTSLNALYKPTLENDFTRLFYHSYQEGTLERYTTGMGKRKTNNETNHVYVRLEPSDFWAVGSYNVGPNSLGENHIDPGFLKRMPLSEEAQTKLKKLCDLYNIPPLESCRTLGEYTNGNLTMDNSAFDIKSHGTSIASTALHAPAIH